MSTDDEVETVELAEVGKGLRAEDPRGSTRRLLVALDARVGVRPREVGDDAQIGDVTRTLDPVQLLPPCP